MEEETERPLGAGLEIALAEPLKLSFRLLGFSSMDEVIEAIDSAPLRGIVGATGDEMFPTDPFPPPLADSKLLLPVRHLRRYF